MSESMLLELILPVSILAQLAAAIIAIRLIRITGKTLAWTLIAISLVCMTVRRFMLLYLLQTTDDSDINVTSEEIGLLASILLFFGLLLTSKIFKTIENAREKVDLASRRLQEASVAGKVVLWDWNIVTGAREWSSLVDSMLGFSPNSLPHSNRAWEARIHPDDLVGVKEAIRRNFDASTPYDVSYRIQRADGTYAWWHEVGHVTRDRNGAPASMAGATVDITERKRREEEYTSIIQTAIDGVAIINAQTGRLLDVNDTYCRLLGYTRAEMLAMRIADFDLTESAGELVAHFQRIVRIGRDRFETRHRCKDGHSVDVAVSVQHLADSGRICAFVTDITERKRNEAALHAHVTEIERFNLLSTQREQRMISLKQEVNQLARELGRLPPYSISPDASAEAAAAECIPEPEAASPRDVVLQDLFERSQLQPLLESFSATAGVATAIGDQRGNILAGANWQPICTHFHRINERTWSRCVESDTSLVPPLQKGKGYALFACRNGLQMAAAPIIIEDRTLGYFFISQFLLDPPDVETFRRQAAEFGFDETAYLNELAKVPVIVGEKLGPLLAFLTSCAHLVEQIGQERLREQRQTRAAHRTTGELHHQREAALNLAQDAMDARRQLETSEESLRRSRDMLAHVLDSVPQAVFWKDRNRVYLGCNQVFAQSLGRQQPQEIAGKTDFDLFASREMAEAYCADDRGVMEQNRVRRHIIETMQTADGAQIWADTTKLPLVDKDGQVYGVLGVYEDITDRRQAEIISRQQDERHRFALEIMGAGEWELDLGSMVAWRSEQHARIFGYEPAQVSWSFAEFMQHVVPEDRERVERITRESLQSGNNLDYECQMLRCDQALRWIWIRGQHVRDEKGRSLRLAGITLDITDRKHEEALMRHSKEHLQLALIAIEDAIWDWAPTREKLFWSPRLFSMLGYAPDEFVPTMVLWESLLHPEDQVPARDMLQQCRSGARDEFQLDARFRAKDGDWFWVSIRGRVLARGLHGEILRMAGTHTDISERKKNEELIHRQLDELQRWQSVMIGREQRTIELKREINALSLRLDEPARYPSAEEEGA